MPIDVHEIEEGREKAESTEEWAPYWADENIKVWAMSVLPKRRMSRMVPLRRQQARSRAI